MHRILVACFCGLTGVALLAGPALGRGGGHGGGHAGGGHARAGHAGGGHSGGFRRSSGFGHAGAHRPANHYSSFHRGSPSAFGRRAGVHRAPARSSRPALATARRTAPRTQRVAASSRNRVARQGAPRTQRHGQPGSGRRGATAGVRPTSRRPGNGQMTGGQRRPGNGQLAGGQRRPGNGQNAGGQRRPGTGQNGGGQRRPGNGQLAGGQRRPGNGGNRTNRQLNRNLARLLRNPQIGAALADAIGAFLAGDDLSDAQMDVLADAVDDPDLDDSDRATLAAAVHYVSLETPLPGPVVTDDVAIVDPAPVVDGSDDTREAEPEYGVEIVNLLQGAAADAGLTVGDVILTFNGVATPTFDALRDAVQESGSDAEVVFLNCENGQRESIVLHPEEGRIGVGVETVPVE
jgi:hypothetical protein